MIDIEIMSGEFWSDAETEYLKENWGLVSKDKLAVALKRTPEALAQKVRRIRLKGGWDRYVARRREARVERHRVVAQLYGQLSLADIARKLGHREDLIRRDASEMGLTCMIRRADSRKAAVQRYYNKGKSASQLASELGCSRNAVIGTARDLGLCKPRAGA